MGMCKYMWWGEIHGVVCIGMCKHMRWDEIHGMGYMRRECHVWNGIYALGLDVWYGMFAEGVWDWGARDWNVYVYRVG